jgi:hypothetical protein
MMHAARIVFLAVLTGILSACQGGSKAVTMEQKIGPAQLTVTQIQSEVMSYADTLATRIAQAADEVRLASDDPEIRVSAHGVKASTILAAFTIASEHSPIAALLDMVVLVSLSHEIAKEHWVQELYGEQGQPLADALRTAKDEIWEIAARVLDEDGLRELERLIRDWREKHPKQVYVSHIRFSDFRLARGQVASAAAGKGGNLLGLFMLDPLSKMTPATRQIEQSRLLGERLFYFSSRLPVLLSWEAEALVYEIMATPESRQLLENTDQYAEVSQRFAVVAEELPDKIAERFAAERQALVEQVEETIATQREALLNDLDSHAATLRPLVSELRETVNAGTTLTKSINSFYDQVQENRPPDARPLVLEDVHASLVEATAATGQLNETIQALERILSSPDKGGLAELEGALALAVALVAVIFVASVLKMFIHPRAAPGQTSIPQTS